jgi:hypothetical protein
MGKATNVVTYVEPRLSRLHGWTFAHLPLKPSLVT